MREGEVVSLLVGLGVAEEVGLLVVEGETVAVAVGLGVMEAVGMGRCDSNQKAKQQSNGVGSEGGGSCFLFWCHTLGGIH